MKECLDCEMWVFGRVCECGSYMVVDLPRSNVKQFIEERKYYDYEETT